MVQPVAEPVVAFQHIGDTGDRPIRPFVQVVHHQRINGAVEPLERRIAGRRPSSGNVGCARSQRIAIMEMRCEIETGFEAVDYPDDVAGHPDA
jgi:hypothetical protein